jgi:hypothetical protein
MQYPVPHQMMQAEPVTQAGIILKTSYVLLNVCSFAMAVWFVRDYGQEKWGLDRVKFEQYLKFETQEDLVVSMQIIGLITMICLHSFWVMEEVMEWFTAYNSYSQFQYQRQAGYGAYGRR